MLFLCAERQKKKRLRKMLVLFYKIICIGKEIISQWSGNVATDSSSGYTCWWQRHQGRSHRPEKQSWSTGALMDFSAGSIGLPCTSIDSSRSACTFFDHLPVWTMIFLSASHKNEEQKSAEFWTWHASSTQYKGTKIWCHHREITAARKSLGVPCRTGK